MPFFPTVQYDGSIEERENEEAGRNMMTALDTQREEALAQAERLNDPRPFVDTAVNEKLVGQQKSQIYRTQLQGAAEKGLVHSGMLSQISAQNAKSAALAQMGLQADEIARRRARLLGLAEESKTIQAGQREADKLLGPQGQWTGGTGTMESKVAARAASMKNVNSKQDRIDEIILGQTKNRYSQEDLESTFRKEIDDHFNTARDAIIEAAQARGIGGDALQGLQDELEQARFEAYAVATGVAEDISGPDPAKASATLGALYAPLQQPMINTDNSQYNPAWSIGFGLVGAGVGGYMGGAAGAKMGYDVGSNVGQIYGAEKAYG